ncbi:hypothetical protein SAMN05444487_10169 [Marininema mesophilum]|uniref:VWFA domain-containing protein n=1 Tax=Marininema mesophilum TaxID=1048340 RepID=A0A1H2Q1R5_9BACL|nr:hypothetical protein [Marininema mesophilum]SDW01052.1 hypothetical protein SAMN05444487_10169 [Marininema mesophilum]
MSELEIFLPDNPGAYKYIKKPYLDLIFITVLFVITEMKCRSEKDGCPSTQATKKEYQTAMKEAEDQLANHDGEENLVYIVSDGLETCGGDPERKQKTCINKI